MKGRVVFIETGRPLAGAKGGGSLHSMLIIADYYADKGYDVELVFRHYVEFKRTELQSKIQVHYLNAKQDFTKKMQRRKFGNILKDSEYKGIQFLRELVKSLTLLKETYLIYRLLGGQKIVAIHLNNRIVPNTHLIWLKLIYRSKMYLHQRQYDRFLIYPKWIYEKLIDKIIAVSTDVKKNLSDLGLKDAVMLYNTCDEQRGISSYSKEIDYFNFVWVGRIVPWKGLHTLVEMLSGLNCHVDIYGSYDELEDYGSSTLSKLSKAGINFSYHGHVPLSEILIGNLRNTFLLHTSIEPEPFGRVVIECMSVGLIPISSGYGGTSELINHGIDGLLISPKEKLLNMFDSDCYDWKRISANAKRNFKDKFSKTQHYKNLNSILNLKG